MRVPVVERLETEVCAVLILMVLCMILGIAFGGLIGWWYLA